MPRSFAVTFDYRCPYARIAHDHIVGGLRAGASWDVRFLPFCLGQAHVDEGRPSVWDDPERDSGIFALQVALAVRDDHPGAFLDVHHGLFELRHRHSGDLRDRVAVGAVLTAAGLDPGPIFATVDDGKVLPTVRAEHEQFVASHQVWGVPTFIAGDAAVFVRLLDLPADGTEAVRTIERVLDQVEWPILNELKHTSVPR